MDRPEASTVAGGHVLVQTLDGVGAGEVAELLVHVVGTGARVVTEPDAKVFNLEGLLLGDLETVRIPFRLPLEGCKGCYNTHDVDANDLAIGLFDLLQLPRQHDYIPVFFFKTKNTHRKKYQKRDFATTSLGANMRMR